ncbi:hypothetical protein KI387_011132, partial [Taxus chinensis]
VMMHLTMGDSEKAEELIQELLGELDLEARFEEEEETDAEHIGRTCLEREK